MTTAAALVAVSVTLAAVLAAWTWREVARLLSRIADVERRLTQADAADAQRADIIDRASRRGRPHHSYDTIHTIEDALALLVEDQLELEAHKARLETVFGSLSRIRQDPRKGQSHD
jgi:hypothetical protein